jgi:hypothetical protein
MAWLEEFFAWRKLARGYPTDLSARQVEAFLILDNEIQVESNHG